MTLIAEVFPKLRSPKNKVRSMSIKSRFKGSFKKQHGKCAQTLLKFAWQNLYHIYWSLWRQLTCKKSLLVICKISRLFPNSLSAYGKYSLFNRGNITQQVQMQVSEKQKTFPRFFAAFLKYRLNFEHFLKKGDPHCWCISQFFAAFLKSRLNFEYFQRKVWLSYLRYFRNYALRKTWLH